MDFCVKTLITGCGRIKIEAESAPAVLFAADELSRYLKVMLGSDNPAADKPETIIRLGYSADFYNFTGVSADDLRFDGFKIVNSPSGILIGSLLERGVLFGVYELLKQNGCVFARGMSCRESIPCSTALTARDCTRNPDFEVRGISLGSNETGDFWEEENKEITDWCAKNYINALFIHQSVNAPLSRHTAEILKEAGKRGMIFEFGGHGAEYLVDRNLFNEKPEMFREKNGVRVKSGNFCGSSPEALDMLAAETVKMLKSAPGIEVFHIWFEDVVEGSWCECSQCRGKNPLEQQNAVIKYISRKLKEEGINTKLDLLLYHDTFGGAEKLNGNKSDAVALFAPRERCYSHVLDDSGCRLNEYYFDCLKRVINIFGAGNVSVFEYYMDMILFSKTTCNIGGIIAGDLKAYVEAGVRNIFPLAFSQYSFWAYEFNCFVYAKHVFDTGSDYENTVSEYIAAFGYPESHRGFLKLIEEFSRNYFRFCGYEDLKGDIRFLPLCAYFGEHIGYIETAMEKVRAAVNYLDDNFSLYSPEYIKNQKTLLDITIREACSVLTRMKVRYENYIKKPDDKKILADRLEKVKTEIMQMIETVRLVPDKVRGSQGIAVFENHLCRDQLFIVDDIIRNELGIKKAAE